MFRCLEIEIRRTFQTQDAGPKFNLPACYVLNVIVNNWKWTSRSVSFFFLISSLGLLHCPSPLGSPPGTLFSNVVASMSLSLLVYSTSSKGPPNFPHCRSVEEFIFFSRLSAYSVITEAYQGQLLLPCLPSVGAKNFKLLNYAFVDIRPWFPVSINCLNKTAARLRNGLDEHFKRFYLIDTPSTVSFANRYSANVFDNKSITKL